MKLLKDLLQRRVPQILGIYLGSSWAHPVVYGARLYIRHQDKLFAYDISK
jgi:hypothetical protein